MCTQILCWQRKVCGQHRAGTRLLNAITEALLLLLLCCIHAHPLQVRLVDVTNPRKVKTLDIYQLPKGAGAHVVKFNPETWIAAVATYLLDIKGEHSAH